MYFCILLFFEKITENLDFFNIYDKSYIHCKSGRVTKSETLLEKKKGKTTRATKYEKEKHHPCTEWCTPVLINLDGTFQDKGI